jgi:LPS export ABC transporter protein LptC
MFAAAVPLGGCGGGTSGGTSPSPSPVGTASPRPSPSATIVPIFVHSNAVGKSYINITQQERNRRVYTLRADKQIGSYLGGNSAVSDFINPHVTFYDKDGKTLISDAPRAHVVEADRSVVMTGGVRARNEQGLTLTCDTMRYDERSDTIVGTGNVVVTTTDGGRYTGQRIDADLRFSQMTMSP